MILVPRSTWELLVLAKEADEEVIRRRSDDEIAFPEAPLGLVYTKLKKSGDEKSPDSSWFGFAIVQKPTSDSRPSTTRDATESNGSVAAPPPIPTRSDSASFSSAASFDVEEPTTGFASVYTSGEESLGESSNGSVRLSSGFEC